MANGNYQLSAISQEAVPVVVYDTGERCRETQILSRLYHDRGQISSPAVSFL